MSQKKMIFQKFWVKIGENQKDVFLKNTAWRLFFLPLLKIQVGEV